MTRQRRRSISIATECFERIKAYAKPRNIPLSQVVEQALAAVVAGSVPLGPAQSSAARGLATKASRGADNARSSLRLQRVAKHVERTKMRAELRARMQAERAKPAPDQFATPAAIRALQAGPPASRLFPRGAFCGVCAEDCAGALYQEPIGKQDALINVCAKCQGYNRGD